MDVELTHDMNTQFTALDRFPIIAIADPEVTLKLKHIRKDERGSWMRHEFHKPKEGRMKKQQVLDELESKSASELAALAGVTLKRGRPSAALRQSLIDEILLAIAEKRVRVRASGEFVRV